VLKIMRFRDNEFSSGVFVAETNLSDKELQTTAEKIREKFEKDDYYDWSYDDIIEEMEKIGAIKIIESEYVEIYL